MMGSGSPLSRSGPVSGGALAPPLRIAAATGLGLGTVVAVLGAVSSPVTVLLSATLVSLLLLLLPAVTSPESAARPDTQRRTRRLLVAAGALPPFSAGAHVAGVPPQALSALVLVAGSTVLVRWLLRWEEEAAGPAPREGAPTAARVQEPPGTDGLADLFGVLPLEALFAEWKALRATSTGTSGPERERLVAALGLLLTELHRRDPQAARRWLSTDPTDPPDRWFDDEPRGQSA
ncbi:hypothetical protein AB2L27_14190 [Kineococcus sp. LSe6-4]|uniref:Uncharacterized protein n=1 Tax=Kineococcus halophytocola TaxID=3234027 RepID=A0ABV4H635_9ACTN